MTIPDDEMTAANIAVDVLQKAEEFDALVVLYHYKDGTYGYYRSTGTAPVTGIGLVEYFKASLLKEILTEDKETE